MATIKANQISQYARQKNKPHTNFLIYGQDSGRIQQCKNTLIRSLGFNKTDALASFSIINISSKQLVTQPEALAEHYLTQSLLQGNCLINLTIETPNHYNTVTSLLYETLTEHTSPNIMIVTAGAIAKGHKLRTLFEKKSNAAAIACYQDTNVDINHLIDQALAAGNQRITPDARRLLSENLGADHLISKQELNKLLLFSAGENEITYDDVAAIICDTANLTINQLCDYVGEGNTAKARREFINLRQHGIYYDQILIGLQRHFTMLATNHTLIKTANNIRAAAAKIQPVIHFSRYQSIQRQVDKRSYHHMLVAIDHINIAVIKIRSTPTLAHDLVLSLFFELQPDAN